MLPIALTLASLAFQEPAAPEHPFGAVLAERVPQLQREHSIPGVAVALLADGAVGHWQGFGSARAGERIPITRDTGFNVGSVTKPIVAWGVMKQVEEGTIELHAPVFRHVTRWELPSSRHDEDGVTIARLLSHTAGARDALVVRERGLRAPTPHTLIETRVLSPSASKRTRCRFAPRDWNPSWPVNCSSSQRFTNVTRACWAPLPPSSKSS